MEKKELTPGSSTFISVEDGKVIITTENGSSFELCNPWLWILLKRPVHIDSYKSALATSNYWYDCPEDVILEAQGKGETRYCWSISDVPDAWKNIPILNKTAMWISDDKDLQYFKRLRDQVLKRPIFLLF